MLFFFLYLYFLHLEIIYILNFDPATFAIYFFVLFLLVSQLYIVFNAHQNMSACNIIILIRCLQLFGVQP